ncbi:tRNA threonylcarbamoyladenosine dehydratase [Thiolapillus sp.]
MDFKRRFGGIARLYGDRALDVFSRSHVCVIGIGGVGSWSVECLARSAIGKLALVDMDHVAESNINRQLPAMSDTLGKAKIEVMAERVARINPDAKLGLLDDFITVENVADKITDDFDYVIDCIDNFRVKSALIAHCRRNHINIVTVGGAGGQVDPTRIRYTDFSRTVQDPLLAKTRYQLRRNYHFPRNPKRSFGVTAVWSDEPPRCLPESPGVCEGPASSGLNCGGFGSCAAVTAGFGMAAAAWVLRKLAENGEPKDSNC